MTESTVFRKVFSCNLGDSEISEQVQDFDIGEGFWNFRVVSACYTGSQLVDRFVQSLACNLYRNLEYESGKQGHGVVSVVKPIEYVEVSRNHTFHKLTGSWLVVNSAESKVVFYLKKLSGHPPIPKSTLKDFHLLVDFRRNR